MRVYGFAASIVLAALALVACGTEVPAPVGRWEPVEQFDSGFAGVLDLREDGTFASGMVVQVSFPYSIEGSTLVFRKGTAGGDGDERVQLAIEGDELRFDGVPARRRVGVATPGVHPIVGVWTYEHYTKATAYERFGTDGMVDLRIPMPGPPNGRFTVTGSTLTLEGPGDPRVFSFEREGALLWLTEEGQSPNALRPVPRWYPFPIDETESARLADAYGDGAPGIISLDTKFLSFGLVRPGARVVRKLRLQSHDPNFDLSNVSVTFTGDDGEPLQRAERYRTEITPVLGMHAVDIQLTLDGVPEGSDGSFRGLLVIETGHTLRTASGAEPALAAGAVAFARRPPASPRSDHRSEAPRGLSVQLDRVEHRRDAGVRQVLGIGSERRAAGQ